ncbi:hypothetical protein AB0L63_25675 [Nocardia sp. NPDC051990]|uniref:hypothetical protein n=1 Tax=Nocardia sp. NPDC051990 TaxID=3155285 RepID=UPI0034291B54
MTTTYTGDPKVLNQTAVNAMACQGELEGYLRSWMSLRDEFASAVHGSQTGTQIQNTMDTAHTAGVKLARTLQEIIDTLKDTGVHIDATDLENAARMARAVELGTNNTVDTGSWQ